MEKLHSGLLQCRAALVRYVEGQRVRCPWFYLLPLEDILHFTCYGKDHIVVYCGILRYIVIYCDILWYIVVYCGILRYIVIYCSLLWYTVVYCGVL